MRHAEARNGIDGLVADCSRQREVVRERAPAYARILAELEMLLERDEAVRASLERALAGRSFSAFYERPLLILASIRYDALREGPSHPLHAALGANGSDPGAVSASRVAASLLRESVLADLGRRFVQTNETSRAVAWLWPAHLAGASRGGRSLALIDIGASAGLNLVADALPAIWRHSDGSPVEVVERPDVVLRQGYDLHPLDPVQAEDAAWLRACIWPGDEARLRRLDEAIEAWRRSPGQVERASAGEIPARVRALLGSLPPETLVIAYQTVMREYLSAEVGLAYSRGMHELVAEQPPGRFVWIELESAITATDGAPPAAITAHLRTAKGVETLELARCHWHPSTVAVNEADAARFAAAFAAPRAG